MTKLTACLLLASLTAVSAVLPVAPAAAQQAEAVPAATARAPATPASSTQVQPLDKIVAVVDEDVILQSELDRAVSNILSRYADRADQLPPRPVLERQVLERLVLSKLQVSRAEGSGINVSDEQVDEAVAGIAKQNNVTPEQMGAQLADDGMTIADLRSSIRDELAIQQLKQSFARSRISVSEGEVDAALASEASTTQYHLAHILVGLPEGATADQIAVGQQKIDSIKAQLDQGKIDFAAAAVRYSDSPNALEGGDLGWRELSQVPPTFAQAIQTLPAGQYFGPIRGPSGFQLIQVLGSRDASAAAGGTITQFRARHILIAAADGQDDAAARARIATLRARIAGGADFATVARENSEDEATAKDGGELGWFAQDAYGVDFGAQVAALQDGQVSEPFHTQAGWHIVEREGSRQISAADDTRRQQVRESIGQRKLEEQWERFLREMRGEAYVDIRLPPLQVGQAAPATQPAAPADGN